MVKKYFSLTLIILLVSCGDNAIEQKDELLFEDVIPEPTRVDSLIVGKSTPLVCSDTIQFIEAEKIAVKPKILPLKTANLYNAEKINTAALDARVKIPIIPDTIATRPFLSYVKHPAPVRAGALRSTGSSREHIQYLDVEQGLAGTNVNCIIEDQFGFMWFGLSSGLTRYDGTYLYHYTTANGLAGDIIQDIFIDSQNRMWIASNEGLMKYDGLKFEIFTAQNGLPISQVDCITEDKKGNIWFIANGVVKYDGKQFYHYNKKNGLRDDNLTTIGFDADDKLFLGYWAQWYDYLKDDTISRGIKYSDPRGEFHSDIYIETMTDSKNNFWVACYNTAVAKIYGDSVSVIRTSKSGPPHLSVDDILEDAQGNIWLSSVEGGVFKMEGDKLRSYSKIQGLNTNFVTDLYEDSKGNIWIGTLGGGVNKLVPNSFKFYDQADGFSAKTPIQLHVDNRGNLLIGTWADGLYSFDGEQFFHHKEGAHGSIIFSFIEDHFNNLVVGAHQGSPLYFRPSDNDTILYDTVQDWRSIPGVKIWSCRGMVKENNGNFWFLDDNHGAYHAILNEGKTNYSRIEHFGDSSGLSIPNINYATVRGDEIWLVYNRFGISKIVDGTITHYTKNNGLISNYVMSLYTDTDNKLWVGTYDGISIFDGTSFSHITIDDGLSNNSVRSIKQDHLGRYWVGTVLGLDLLEKDSTKKCGYSISTYSSQDGLQATEFINNCVALDSNNTMWWGTRKGLISLNLNNFEKKNSIPEVVLTSLSIDDEHVSFNSSQANKEETDSIGILNKLGTNGIKPFFNLPENLVLPYDINALSFYFSTMTSESSHQVRYQYRLVGFNDNWSAETVDGIAKYSNLPPGDFTFEVKAGIHNKNWGPVASYSFKITPPFWQTWWFRILAFCILVLILYLIFRWRNRALLKRQEQLEQTVTERTQEIQEQKTLIEEKQIEILDSINYAQRIQKALLASDDLLQKNLKDYFVYFQPKDIVSGDFYWCAELPQKQFLLLTADSTGHGVPGAIMSMLNIASVEKAIESEKLTSPSDILNFTRKKIIETLAKDGSADGGKDGMDCSLVSFDFETKTLTYSAANNGIWVIRQGELLEFAPDKMPVGKHDRDSIPFKQEIVQLQKGDIVYTFTDGLPDQFGGDKGKKFKYKSLKNLLLENAQLPMNEQSEILQKTFISWKGDLEQVDDVCVIGVRI